MRTQRVWLLGLVGLALTGGNGCTLISNLDRFKEGDGGAADAAPADGGGPGLGCKNQETLCVRLMGFSPHVNELVDIDLVSADHTLRARAILDPLGGLDGDVVMPLAIPANEVPKTGKSSPLHLEIWADKSEDRKYTAAKDHDWVEPLPASGNDVFVHNSAFTDLLPRPRAIGNDFTLHLTGYGIHKGKVFEVMVIERQSGRTVGLYRLHQIPGDAIDLTIPEIIDDSAGVLYRVEYYVDIDGNGFYNDAEDHSWVFDKLESTSTGLSLTAKHDVPQLPLTYQFKFEK